MLPNNPRGTVYINPNFKSTHINPKFLRKNIVPNSIHINPAFFEKPNIDQVNNNNDLKNICINKMEYLLNLPKAVHYDASDKAQTIPDRDTKFNRKIDIEEFSQHEECTKPIENKGKLMKFGKRKLIRSTVMTSEQSINRKYSKEMQTKQLTELGKKYKIDRRIIITPTKFLNGVKKKSYVSQFALCRNNMTISPLKISMAHKQIIRKISSKAPGIPCNLKLELLNVNGVLYKSTRTKLQRKISINSNHKEKVESEKLFPKSRDRILFVRGNKFVLDKSCLKLTKIQSNHPEILTEKNRLTSMKRIDIGGLTYVAKSNNVFIRTDFHVTRNYLSITKQRSINTLKNRMVKTNIPCPIYRKLGKCVAFEKNNCPKLHEKNQIAICSKFLKGECSNSQCLLSHNVNFSKMPVCRFFLQGFCIRQNCPYLHRKLAKTVEICREFLKGFCALAEKCPKRHEFLCPDYESKGKCEKTKCIYCTKRIKGNLVRELIGHKSEKKLQLPETDKKTSREFQISRYFVEMDNQLLTRDITDLEDDNLRSDSLKRQKLGKLPSFIPL